MIITTTEEDFLNAEIAEWGFDYVDTQFALGYNPKCVNGVWCWKHSSEVSEANNQTVRSQVTWTMPINSPSRVIQRK